MIRFGGDCTNFVSQCLYAGKREMNYRGYGWYYENANNKSASWTGVEYLYNFLINNKHEGPRANIVDKNEIEIGDVIELSFNGIVFGHSLIVSEISGKEIIICTHTIDAKDRNLNTYNYERIRYLHIT